MRTSIGGAPKDDFSFKHVIVKCPDGDAVLSYAGAGSIPVAGKYVDISDWVRQILRGPARRLDETFIYLRERATEDLGKLLSERRIAHMFTGAAFLDGVPWVLQIRNFPEWRSGAAPKIEPVFQTSVGKIPPGNRLITYWPPLQPSEHQRLTRLSPKRPRHWKEVSKLLASVNLQVAKRKPSTVSRHCVVTYLANPKDLKDGVHTEFCNGDRQIRPFFPACICLGIDMTDISRLMLLKGEVDAANFKEADRNSVVPKNPLRPGTLIPVRSRPMKAAPGRLWVGHVEK
jgi:hypothetical protein